MDVREKWKSDDLWYSNDWGTYIKISKWNENNDIKTMDSKPNEKCFSVEEEQNGVKWQQNRM